MGELTDPAQPRRARARSVRRSRRPRPHLPRHEPERRGGERVGRRDRDRHRVPARGPRARRSGVPHAAAGLPAHALDRRRRRGAHGDRRRLLRLDRPGRDGGRGRVPGRHRAAQPPRGVADVGVRRGRPRAVGRRGRVRPAPHDRRHGRRTAHLRTAAEPRGGRGGDLDVPGVPPVAASLRRHLGAAEPLARRVAQRAAADDAAPLDELRDRPAVRRSPTRASTCATGCWATRCPRL